MDTSRREALRTLQRAIFLAGIAGVAGAGLAEPIEVSAVGNGYVEPPATSEFGFGPRASARRVYQATLQPSGKLRLRQLQTVAVRVVDAEGRPVENATITVDGGMPQHNHGLPTRPLVKRSLGGGVYEIEGVRFSMGGWWELRLAIESPAGRDQVTFNLSL